MVRRTGKRKRKQGIVLTKGKITVLILVIVMLVAGGIVLGLNWQRWFGDAETTDEAVQPDLDEDAVAWQGEKQLEGTDEAQQGIAIPGYKSITLQADQLEQSVNLHNPDTNDCYFVMSLILPDGTEIWRSKMIAPGMGLYEITLEQTVPAGTYENSILKYECYKQDENLTPLNGGEVKLTLEVKE